MHATNPKGIVGGFELTVFQRNLKEWQERPSAEAVEICLRVLKESNKSRFDSYSVRNSVLIISHITFLDCRVHMFSDNLSRNSCIWKSYMWTVGWRIIWKKIIEVIDATFAVAKRKLEKNSGYGQSLRKSNANFHLSSNGDIGICLPTSMFLSSWYVP